MLWVCLAVPLRAATVERRSVPAHNGLYLLFKPDKFDPNKSYDSLLVLRGEGDTAEHFTRSWKHLVDLRPNLLLAVPQGTQRVGGKKRNALSCVHCITTLSPSLLAIASTNAPRSRTTRS